MAWTRSFANRFIIIIIIIEPLKGAIEYSLFVLLLFFEIQFLYFPYQNFFGCKQWKKNTYYATRCGLASIYQ